MVGVNFWMICLQRIIEKQNKVVITDRMWARVLSSTNQPSFLMAKDVTGYKGTDEEDHESNELLDNGNCSDESFVSNEKTK